ncbi:MAG: pyridoxal-phosphate dependent enzyme [Burkholderiales bacterium]
MARPSSLVCIRCGAASALTTYARGCGVCAAAGVAANLTVAYDSPLSSARPVLARASMWRFDAWLPVDASDAVTLGEGNTPLVPVPKLGLGRLWIKDESRNPTWSFKDRLASASVSMAVKLGAQVIASSSSGNAGAATAAYAAKAGLPCIVVTYQSAAGPMVTQMRAYGAMVLTVPTSADRWRVLSAAVERFGWYPTSVYYGPAVGSNPYGIEGYKTIAYEIAEALDWQSPDWCVLPVCYGDALYGMWKGFEEMRRFGWIDRVPRFAAAEISGSIEAAMDSGVDQPPVRERSTPTIAGSIGASQGTYQGVHALRASNGVAMYVDDDAMLAWQEKLARSEGIWTEPSAAATLPVIERLRARGVIERDATVVALMTAGGLKDPDMANQRLGHLPAAKGDVDDALRVLKEAYGFDARA